MPVIVLVHRMERGPDILCFCVSDDIMNRVEDVSAASGKNRKALCDLRRHFFRRPGRKRVLRIDTAAPEYKTIAPRVWIYGKDSTFES